MLTDTRRALVAAMACLLACGRSSDGQRLEAPRSSRAGLRAEALGCWSIRSDPLKPPFRGTWWLPERLRLDTAVARHINARGYRVARRLDKSGQPLLKDGEGFSIIDTWAADSVSDRITITTSNGLYGAVMVLNLSSASSSNAMRGHGQEYGDVYPQPDVPIVPLRATRVECDS